jgi:ribonuclease P protein component
MKTICSPAEIDRLFGRGLKASDATLLVIALRDNESRDPKGRVIFVAGKRLGGAVARNRAKRVLRDAVRRAEGPWPGWDVALVARAATGTAKVAELDRSLRAALRRLGLSP